MRRATGTLRRSLLLLATVTVAAACDRGEPGARPAPAAPVDVRVTTPRSAPSTLAHAGRVTSASEAELATRTSGRVEAVRVDVGSRVRAGEPLVELDRAGVDARISSARAAVERARRSFERIRNLERDGAATEQELDDARAALAGAEAGLEEALAQRGYVILRAPFAGTISARSVDPGDLATPGVPVLVLLRPDSLKVVVDLPGPAARGLGVGERATLRDPAGDGVWEARIAAVSPARDPASRRVRVELRPTAGPGAPFDLAPGSVVRVERPSDAEATLWLPSDATVRRGQLTGTFVVRDGSLRLRWIRVGTERTGAVEVLAGLAAADSVVRSPAPDLVDGTPVGAVTPDPWSPDPEQVP